LTLMDDVVYQGCFSVVNVCDNGNVSDAVHGSRAKG
jgi:hypothetical protein